MTVDRETIATAIGGAALGAVAGGVVGAPVLGASIGGVNGWLTGWRRVYDWSSWRGRAAFVLDSTWALVSTGAGVVLLAGSYLRERAGGRVVGFETSLSRRQNRMVHCGGIVLRRGFAVTIGNVINGAGGVDGRVTERRRKLVTDHEDVHVWQERVAGPLYPVFYGLWYAGGTVAALAHRSRSSRRLSELIDAYAYYRNPLEWYAYSRDDNWPPAGVDRSLVWKRSLRGFGGSRAERR